MPCVALHWISQEHWQTFASRVSNMTKITNPLRMTPEMWQQDHDPWECISLGSLDVIQQIALGGELRGMVWPDEGSFGEGIWTFNNEHSKLFPVIMDFTSANMIIALYNALDNKDRKKFRKDIAKSRDSFEDVYQITISAVKINDPMGSRAIH